jgi:hypothetical protein
MTKKVFALDTQPGIQRDGTVFDTTSYNDGEWVRFQRGRPRKIQGYSDISPFFAGISRGIYLDPQNTYNAIFSGYNNGMQVLSVNNNGVGTGVIDMTLTGFTPDDRNLWQMDSEFDSGGTNLQTLLAHPGLNIDDITNELNTPVLGGDITGTTLAPVGVFTATGTAQGTNTIVLDVSNLLVGAGQLVTGTNVPVNTYVVSIVGGVTVDLTNPVGAPIVSTNISNPGSGYTNGVYLLEVLSGGTGTGAVATITVSGGIVTTAVLTTYGNGYIVGDVLEALALPGGTGFELTVDICSPLAVTFTFDNQIEVSGGVTVLHPYTFVYGNNGLIKNNAAGNLNDWVSADSNETNAASTKIVKGLPVRGGTNAPSGLFWALDSLIRVSYAPTTISSGPTSSTFFWRYDVISSQSSILSSQCVIEYDGIYYWIGTDRFLMYNGVVKEIPNTFNQNYFFDNLNYQQRQKVWATKVPRYGEIWWYYPRGNSEECNDAIIYNIRENCWYDAGESEGARRSAGYFSQVFRHPIAMDWLTNISPVGTGAIQNYPPVTNGGSGYTDGSYYQVPLVGSVSGQNAYATVTVTAGEVTEVAMASKGYGFTVGETVTSLAAYVDASISGTTMTVSNVIGGYLYPGQYVTGVSVTPGTQIVSDISGNGGVGDYEVSVSQTVTPDETMACDFVPGGGFGWYIVLTNTDVQNLVTLYQHEIGYNAVINNQVYAIPSYFETNNLGWVQGGPAQQSPEGTNYWLRIERVEPDFVQTGDMELYVTGRPFAQAQDQETGPYIFSPNTNKIDMKEQRRELRLKFVSNVVDGNYQLGYLLLNADIGDVRGY